MSTTTMQTISIKIALVGDANVGKSTLLVRYVNLRYGKSTLLVRYVNLRYDATITLGVAFMEKTIQVNSKTKATLSLWDLGGSFEALLPIVVNSAVAVVFLFDLTRKESLDSVKKWFKDCRALNKTSIPFLCGTKYDLFTHCLPSEQEATITQARKYAQAMKAPLIFTSALETLNIAKLFKLVFLKVFDLPIDLLVVKEGPIIEGFESSLPTP